MRRFEGFTECGELTLFVRVERARRLESLLLVAQRGNRRLMVFALGPELGVRCDEVVSILCQSGSGSFEVRPLDFELAARGLKLGAIGFKRGADRHELLLLRLDVRPDFVHLAAPRFELLTLGTNFGALGVERSAFRLQRFAIRLEPLVGGGLLGSFRFEQRAIGSQLFAGAVELGTIGVEFAARGFELSSFLPEFRLLGP